MSALAALLVPAVIVSVLDGDTFKVEAHPWPGVVIETSVRVRDLDTPEKTWRAQCDVEQSLGDTATHLTQEHLPPGTEVTLSDLGHGKYAGRVVANVTLVDGTDWATFLVDEGLGRRYDGGAKDSWCPTGGAHGDEAIRAEEAAGDA